MTRARLVLAVAAVAGVAATAAACRPAEGLAFAWPVLALLLVAAVAAAACLLRPHAATWSVAAVGLVAAAAVRFAGALDPEWGRGLLAAAGILAASEALHLTVRSRRWPLAGRHGQDAAVLRLAGSMTLRATFALGVTTGLVAAWALLLEAAAPPVMAASLERWSGWALAGLLVAAVAVAWLAVGRWGARRSPRDRPSVTQGDAVVPTPAAEGPRPTPLHES